MDKKIIREGHHEINRMGGKRRRLPGAGVKRHDSTDKTNPCFFNYP